MLLIYGAPLTGKTTLRQAVAAKFKTLAVDIDDLARALQPRVFELDHSDKLKRDVIDYSNLVLEGLKRSSLRGVGFTHNERSSFIIGFSLNEEAAKGAFSELVRREASVTGKSEAEVEASFIARGYTPELVKSWYSKKNADFESRIIRLKPGEYMSDYISFGTNSSGEFGIRFVKPQSAYPAYLFNAKPYIGGKVLVAREKSSPTLLKPTFYVRSVLPHSTVSNSEVESLVFVPHPKRATFTPELAESFRSARVAIFGVDGFDLAKHPIYDSVPAIKLLPEGKAWFVHGVNGTGIPLSDIQRYVNHDVEPENSVIRGEEFWFTTHGNKFAWFSIDKDTLITHIQNLQSQIKPKGGLKK